LDKVNRIFKPSEAHKLEDPARLSWLPPAEVIERLPLGTGMRVVDVGAGTGYFSIPIARIIAPAGEVFAVDLQPEMLDLLASKLSGPDAPQNISLQQGSAAKLPLPDASADLVFFANIWHELDDTVAAVREARRLLTPAGKIAILDWQPDAPPPPGPPQDHRVAASDVVRLLTANGCNIIYSENVGQFSYLVLAS
jgi:ubiquinone/menaquinone biosynthesis C-methylase UbiE